MLQASTRKQSTRHRANQTERDDRENDRRFDKRESLLECIDGDGNPKM
jgi:hypothetical protein